MTGTLGAARLDSLTGLRFAAACMVVAIHGSYLLENQTLAHAMQRGGVGVVFFFALSGFVLTWSARAGDPRGAFYRRRFARVYPNHALTWLGAVVLYAIIRDDGTPLSQVLPLTLTHAWVWDADVYFGANGVSWSLACEAFFYAVFPFLIPGVKRLGRSACLRLGIGCYVLIVALHVLAAPGSGSWGWFLNVFPPVQLLTFVIGMALGAAVCDGWRSPVGLKVATAVTVLCLGAAMWVPILWTAVIVLPGFAMLLAAASTADVEGQSSVYAHPWMVRLGEWSFALYLVHQMLFESALERYGAGHFGVGAGLALIAALTGCAVLSAALLYHLWEVPLERRLRGAPGLASKAGPRGTRRPSTAIGRP